MKLAFFDARPEDAEALAIALPDGTITTFAGSLNDHVTEAADADAVSIFVDSSAPAEILRQLPKVKLVAARSAGVDHIDLKYCQDNGITVANVPHYGEHTVAEHTFALILALSRKIFQSYERTEKMNFDRAGLTGFDLNGRTLGVIGTGNIGRNVINLGRGFGMQVVAYDVKPDPKLAAELSFVYTATLDEVLKQSDVITLHVPYLESTKHLINNDNLKLVKRGSILINTARGGLIDTQALFWALEEGILAGAGLDVLEEEHDTRDRVEFLSRDKHSNKDLITMLHNHALVARNDVIITPHNAFNSVEAIQRIFDTTVENIQAYASGAPINLATH